MMKVVVLLALLAVAGAATTSRLADDEKLLQGKNRPVTKVVTLLRDMQKQLEKEQEEDEEVYEKMACWCETNDKTKTKAIADAEQKIADLTASIEEGTATSARLNTEIKNLNKEIAKNQEALDKATALRTKQLAEFNAEEKDLLQSISSLRSAVTVLSKHHAPPEGLLEVAVMLRSQFRKNAATLNQFVTPSQRKAVQLFIQKPAEYLEAEVAGKAFVQEDQPAGFKSYAPASGEIFGILKQMKETFENNLSTSQKEEMANQKAYEDLKAAKLAEIQAGQDQVDTKTQELADTDENLANDKNSLADTEASLSADQKFLMDLKQKCKQTDAEWEERQKTRQEEIQAVSKALAILSSDDAHDTFSSTLGFVQVNSDNRRNDAAKVISQAASKFHHPGLANLATSVRLDAFTKVKKAIDDMVSALLKEKDDEIKHKDFCVAELNENTKAQESKDRDISDLNAKKDQLESTIKTLTDEIKTLTAEIADMKVQLKRAGEDREKQNKEFQMTVADQRETQKLLVSALNVLKGFYNKKSFLQAGAKQPAGPPPPPSFKSYENNKASGGVMGMLQGIINEAKMMEKDAITAESDSQQAYEDFVKDTNDTVDQKNKEMIDKKEVKAKTEASLTETKQNIEAATTEAEQLDAEEADLHKSCDYTMKNFEIRQTARDEEVEALRQAKAILSGAKFSELLQG